MEGYAFNPAALPTLVTAAASSMLGLTVLARERGSFVGWSFALVTGLVTLWLLALSGLYLVSDPALADRWARALYLSVPFIPVAIYRFSALVMKIEERRRSWIRAGWIVAALFAVAMVGTPHFVDARSHPWGFYPRFKPPTLVFLTFFLGTMLWTFVDYHRAIARAPEGMPRLRLRALRFAFVVGYLGSVDYLAAYGAPVRPFGFVPVLVFLVMSGIAIQRYRLVDLTPSFAAEQIVATMADPLLVCDADGVVRVVNPAAARVFGWDDGALLGAPVDRLCPDASPGESLAALLERAPLRHHAIRLRARDGSQVHVSLSISVLAERGQTVGWVLALHDVTELKEAQGALNVSEERYRDLFENANDIVYTHDLSGRFTSVNHAAERLLGWTRDEALQLSMSDLVGPEGLEQGRELRQRKLDGEPVTTFEVAVRDRAGRSVTLEVSNRLLFEDGRPVAVHGIARDVTARRAAEDALRGSEERYRLLFERNLAGVCRSTIDGRALDCNEAFARMLGYASVAEMLEHPSVSMYFDPADRERLVERLVAEGRITNFENRLRRRDGTAVDVLVNLSLRDEPGVGRVIEGVAIDITERKRLEEQLRQAQKMEAIGRLSGGIAHDFNNIITVISGFAGLVRHKIGENAPALHDIDQIQRAADRAAALTRQLLAFARRQVIQPQVLDVWSVVRDMEGMLRRLLGDRIDLVARRPAEPVRVRADQGQLEQVLMNLVVNARDAMAGSGTLTIVVGCRDDAAGELGPSGAWAMLTVTDTGSGMDEATRARIFEPFFTTKERGQGTGLGLATVYGIVTQGGGHVGVDSAPGRGSTFTVLLPPWTEDVPVATPRPIADGQRVTVLLSAPSDVECASARDALRAEGHRVLVATSGREALELASEYAGPIDVLVAEAAGTPLDGRTLARLLEVERPGVRLLLVGAGDGASLEPSGVGVGIGIIQRPFAPDELVRAVRALL